MRTFFPLLMILFLIASGCSAGESGGNGQPNYEETKKMVIDILKTDEGKKAIEELISDTKIKEQLVIEQPFVEETIKKNLTSKAGEEFWKKLFEDPKFAESFAKSMQKSEEKLLKDLMKDPEYQKMMIELYQNPELEKQLLTVMKSQEYREHLQKLMQETFDSPLFKGKIQDLLLKAAEKAGAGQGGEQEGGGEGAEGQSSDGGGSGGGGQEGG